MSVVNTPWNDDQVNSLNQYQHAAWVHPFTCGNDICRHKHDQYPLVATVRGWICVYCDYSQDWVHEFMADWSWRY